MVIRQNPITAEKLAERLRAAIKSYEAAPDEMKAQLGLWLFAQRMALFYIRKMLVYKSDGSIDAVFAPKIKVGPAVSIQLLDAANVTSDDRILHLFSGVGYFTFFIALNRPAILDCVDAFTPRDYNLPRTFLECFNWIYQDLPGSLHPTITRPNYLLADASKLPRLSRASGFQASNYNKVFLTHPFGRGYDRINELEAFVLWLKSLDAVGKRNKATFSTYSLVPSEWMVTVEEIRRNEIGSLETSIKDLRAGLSDCGYYQGRSELLAQMPAPNGSGIGRRFFSRLRRFLENREIIEVEDTHSYGRSIYITHHTA